MIKTCLTLLLVLFCVRSTYAQQNAPVFTRTITSSMDAFGTHECTAVVELIATEDGERSFEGRVTLHGLKRESEEKSSYEENFKPEVFHQLASETHETLDRTIEAHGSRAFTQRIGSIVIGSGMKSDGSNDIVYLVVAEDTFVGLTEQEFSAFAEALSEADKMLATLTHK